MVPHLLVAIPQHPLSPKWHTNQRKLRHRARTALAHPERHSPSRLARAVSALQVHHSFQHLGSMRAWKSSGGGKPGKPKRSRAASAPPGGLSSSGFWQCNTCNYKWTFAGTKVCYKCGSKKQTASPESTKTASSPSQSAHGLDHSLDVTKKLAKDLGIVLPLAAVPDAPMTGAKEEVEAPPAAETQPDRPNLTEAQKEQRDVLSKALNRYLAVKGKLSEEEDPEQIALFDQKISRLKTQIAALKPLTVQRDTLLKVMEKHMTRRSKAMEAIDIWTRVRDHSETQVSEISFKLEQIDLQLAQQKVEQNGAVETGAIAPQLSLKILMDIVAAANSRDRQSLHVHMEAAQALIGNVAASSPTEPLLPAPAQVVAAGAVPLLPAAASPPPSATTQASPMLGEAAVHTPVTNRRFARSLSPPTTLKSRASSPVQPVQTGGTPHRATTPTWGPVMRPTCHRHAPYTDEVAPLVNSPHSPRNLAAALDLITEEDQALFEQAERTMNELNTAEAERLAQEDL